MIKSHKTSHRVLKAKEKRCCFQKGFENRDWLTRTFTVIVSELMTLLGDAGFVSSTAVRLLKVSFEQRHPFS